MAKFICSICGFVYDEEKGIPSEGIPTGTRWEELPDDWVCPICGATKEDFQKQGESETAPKKEPLPVSESSADMREISAMEVSALCTNLARGCEKQYKSEEAALFRELSTYFKAKSSPAKDPDYDSLLQLIEKDLQEGIPEANTVAAAAKDRGALRALVWNEKVTRILKSILTRYQKEGDAMLANTGVYVCTICGFIYIGDKLPDVCPVCKVPNWKFEKIEGRK